MRRRLLNFLTVLSLMLCVAVCGLWARSHTRCDQVGGYLAKPRQGERPYGYTALLSAYRGGLYLLWLESGRTHAGFHWGVGTERIDRPYIYDPDPGQGWLGFRYSLRRGAVENAPGFVGVPFWFVATLLAAPAVAAAVRRRLRPRPGLCASCGYDLRATPGRCPECGTLSPPQPAG